MSNNLVLPSSWGVNGANVSR